MPIGDFDWDNGYSQDYEYNVPSFSRQINEDNQMKVVNKFYCGAREILTNGWAKYSEIEAIEHAKDLLLSDSTRDHVAIVKIVKIVRRKTPVVNIIVENVK